MSIASQRAEALLEARLTEKQQAVYRACGTVPMRISWWRRIDLCSGYASVRARWRSCSCNGIDDDFICYTWNFDAPAADSILSKMHYVTALGWLPTCRGHRHLRWPDRIRCALYHWLYLGRFRAYPYWCLDITIDGKATVVIREYCLWRPVNPLIRQLPRHRRRQIPLIAPPWRS